MENKETHLPYFGLGKMLPYISQYKWTIITMVILGLGSTAVDISIPLFQKYALTNFIGKNTLVGLKGFILAYAGALTLQIILNLISCYQTCYVEMCIGRDMKRDSFNHLQTLAFSYFNHNSVGYIHARVMNDTAHVGGFIAWSLMDVVWHLSYIIGAVGVMLTIDFRLALCVIAILPIIALIASYFQGKLVTYNRKVREINSRITGGFNEGITGAKTIKTMVLEEKMEKGFFGITKEMREMSVTTMHFRSMFLSIISFASSLALATVLWRGGIITEAGLMEVATLSVFMSYAMNLMDPVQWVIRSFSNMITTQVNIERFTNLMETKSDVTDRPDVIEKYGDAFEPKRENWEELYGDIEFDDVSFKYPDGDEYIFEHFNLKVPKGTNVAIVGETGAGKSTLINLVCRFFEPTDGRVLIDGRDARDRSQLWLHSNIGYVLQTPHLFSGTILDNLRYGKPDATMEEIEAAVKSVSADGVIAKMEKGYLTEVGEGGDILSTGEKQLISFARAILADPALFVLDEATSSVDTVTEKLIQGAIEKLMEGRTSFIVAHRLSTIINADVILAVRDGKIVEQGSHSELMRQKGYYYKLYTRQFNEEQINSVLS